MLRFSVDPGPQRANLSAVYALFGVVLIPVSFSAIRLAKAYFHPQVFTLHGPNFGGWILVTYCIAQAAMLVLAYTLYRLELGGKQLDVRLRRLREVLRLTTAEKYVTAAYCVVFAVVLVYVLIMALKLQRLEREVDELAGRVPDEDAEEAPRETARVG